MCDLYLSENKHITDAGVVALSEMLKKNKTLKKHRMSVGEKGASALISSLEHNKTMTEVWLPWGWKSAERSKRIITRVKKRIHFIFIM